MGAFAGYFSARTYKMFEGKYYLRCAFLTAMVYPAVVFTTFFILNIAFAI
jgi:transmembrane 9 superfamily protein 2/4